MQPSGFPYSLWFRRTDAERDSTLWCRSCGLARGTVERRRRGSENWQEIYSSTQNLKSRKVSGLNSIAFTTNNPLSTSLSPHLSFSLPLYLSQSFSVSSTKELTLPRVHPAFPRSLSVCLFASADREAGK
nr:hypothetical protein Iba_chr03dCG12900 [Ipomoea batatas]